MFTAGLCALSGKQDHLALGLLVEQTLTISEAQLQNQQQ